MKRINSKEIARLAGVSRSTVSRVINSYPDISKETYDKVMKVIKEYNYYPQVSGQLLAGKNTGTIGFFWINESKKIGSDMLSSEFFVHIIDSSAAMGYLVLSCIMNNVTDKENIDFIRKTFLEGRIDAGIFVGIDNDEPLIDELTDLGMIVGLFDYYHENENLDNRITVNFERNSGEKIIDYIHGLGHKDIGIIAGSMKRFSTAQRHESFLRGMEKYGLEIRDKWFTYGGITYDSGYLAACDLLDRCNGDLPTVICANNDSVAFGLYSACKERGLRIPEDISVVGIDGHLNGQYVSPPLTTISFDFRSMFFSLVSRVVDAIHQRENLKVNEFIQGNLIERKSCKNLNKS